MSKARGITILVFVGIGAVVSYFTVGGADVAKWNDKVITLEERFGQDWKVFEPNIGPWLEGKPMDVEKMEAAFKVYSRDVGQTAGEMRRETPPDDPLCKEFHGLLIQYADLQEAQLVDLRKILDGMKAANPAREADLKKVEEAVDALGKKEAELQALINARQKVMAAKFKLKLQ